jgi:spore germination cell wall hydrolase CwlJ-like protein
VGFSETRTRRQPPWAEPAYRRCFRPATNAACARLEHEILIADDASRDDSIAQVRKRVPRVQILTSPNAESRNPNVEPMSNDQRPMTNVQRNAQRSTFNVQ